MDNKSTSSLIIRMALLLMVICGIVSAVLGGVNYITKDTIAAITAQKTADAYAEVLPTSGSYTEVAYTGDNATVDAVATCEEGTIVKMTVSGAQGMITLVVGVDNDGAVSGVSIVEHAETPGLGALATGAEWRATFKGQTADMALTKKGGEIESLTGATITSQAVVDACNAAIEIAANMG